MRIGKDLVAASATPLVLGILADGQSYGYAILQRISVLSDGELDFSDGMLYPLLHRLERLGHVESSWSQSTAGRRRKLYRLTAEGRAALAEHKAQWNVVGDALRRVWREAASAPPVTARPILGGV